MSELNNEQQAPAANEPGSLVAVTAPATQQPDISDGKDPENQVYPEQKNTWYFDDKADKAMGIETYRYDNESISKRCTLSDGRKAVCRRLKGKDRHLINRLVENSTDKGGTYKDAVTAVSTKIDDKDIVIEDLDSLWFNDLINIQTMASTLNFI